jgi:putative ABC transport system permease protein
MIAPRWRKVLRDLWNTRVRTLLIILSIAVGVFAIGTVVGAAFLLSRDIPQQYASIQPSHINYNTTLFDDEVVKTIRHLPQVNAAEGRRTVNVRLAINEQATSWRDLALYQIADFNAQQVYQVSHLSGEWPPQKGSLVMDRGSLAYLNLKEGQKITIKTSDGRIRQMQISGTVLDIYHMPAFMEGTVYGFINEDSLEWLGEEAGYDDLFVRVRGDVQNTAVIQQAADKIKHQLEEAGLTIYQTNRPKPGQFPLDYIVNTLILLLISLGGMVLFVGGFLIINTISALLAQQVRQIGVIKAVGGRTSQVAGIYLGMVLILGLLASILGILPSVFAGQTLAGFLAELLNFNVNTHDYPYWVILLQLAVGLLVPLTVALFPILAGARVPPAQALSEYGRSQVSSQINLLDRFIRRFIRPSQTLVLALRNPFRRRSRLVLSLLTLTLAGASFIAILNLQLSLQQTIDNMLNFWQYDLWLQLDHTYPVDRLQFEATQVAGIQDAEGWNLEISRRIRPDKTESNTIMLFAVPDNSQMTKPRILSGRWLQAGDENKVVISSALLNAEPDLALDKNVVFKIDGKEKTFVIVGVIQNLGNQTIGYPIYTNLSTLNRILRSSNRTNMVVIRTEPMSSEKRRIVSDALEKRFDQFGLPVESALVMDDERAEINSAFNIIIGLLMLMVLLLALVGGLGLTGTMSLSIIERTREIGVMRAFGASNLAVFQSVLVEGLLIGVMSWFFSLALAVPLTQLMCDVVGNSFLSSPVDFQFSLGGSLLWLFLVLLISAVSSVLPAWNAVSLTVREVLAFE